MSIITSLVAGPGPSATRSPDAALDAVRSIVRRTRYPAFEVCVAVPEALAPAERAALLDLAPDRIRVVPVERSVSPTAALNVAAGLSGGQLLVLLGADLEILTEDWLTELCGFAQRPGVGAVGPKVFSPDGRVEHAGIVLPRGVPRHVLYGADGGSTGPVQVNLPANYSAVSGACLMTRRALFAELSGLREPALVGYSDVDYCLRLRQLGYRVVFTPYAKLRYLQQAQWSGSPEDVERRLTFRRHWSALPAVDPYYNAYFDQADGQFRLDPFS